jgi:hypothetical protein
MPKESDYVGMVHEVKCGYFVVDGIVLCWVVLAVLSHSLFGDYLECVFQLLYLLWEGLLLLATICLLDPDELDVASLALLVDLLLCDNMVDLNSLVQWVLNLDLVD